MTTTAISQNFKLNCMTSGHNFNTLTYKMLLIKPAATGAYDSTLANVGTPGAGSPSVTNVGTDEASATGYTSGGVAMSSVVAPALSAGVAIVSWSTNPSWTVTTSLSAISGVIYTADATLGSAGRTVGNFDFGGTQTTSGTLTVVLPTNSSTLAIIRIS